MTYSAFPLQGPILRIFFFIFIYYHPDLLFYQGYYYRDARIDIINNDLFAILNINKYIQSLFLPDFIALLGFIDSALGPIDRCDPIDELRIFFVDLSSFIHCWFFIILIDWIFVILIWKLLDIDFVIILFSLA